MRKLAVVVCAAGLASCSSGPDYPGDWQVRGSKSAKITATMGVQYMDCAKANYYYKMADGEADPGEALVYCPREDGQWDSYLVWYKIGKVMGVAKEPDWTPPAISSEEAEAIAVLKEAVSIDLTRAESAQSPQSTDSAKSAADAAEEAMRAAELAAELPQAAVAEPSAMDAAAQAVAAAEAAATAVDQ